MMIRSVFGLSAAIVVLGLPLSVTCAGCSDAAVSANTQNIYAFPPDAGVLLSDQGPTADSQSRRDAAVRTSSGCGGILINPRVVATAAHCRHPARVFFGRQWATAGETANVIGCFVHPGARIGGVASCDDPSLSATDPLRTSLDWTVLILDRRVDAATFGTTIRATPATVPTIDPALALGTPLHWVSGEHVPSGGSLAIDPTLGRVFANLEYGGTGEDLGPAYGAYTHFIDDAASEFLSVFFGDSGSPFYAGDPDAGPISLVALTTGARGDVPPGVDAGPTIGPGFDAGTVLWNPNIRGTRPAWDPGVYTSFLAPYVDCSRGGCGVYIAPAPARPIGRRVYVGPADRPYRGDPSRTVADDTFDSDGDGLDDATHDICPRVFDPDQLDTDGDGTGDACDDCAAVANPLQENCNVDSEDTQRTVELAVPISARTMCSSDADCDATQFCGVADAVDPTDQRACAGTTGCFCLTARRGDRCDSTPCGSTLDSMLVTGGGTTARVEQLVLRVDGRSAHPEARAGDDRGSTGFRVCPCVDAVRDDEQARARCAAACPLNAVDEYRLALRDGRDRDQWRLITTNDITTSATGAGETDVGRYDLPYSPLASEGRFTTDGAFATTLASDVTRWCADGRFVASYPSCSSSTPTQFSAVIWTHTSTFGVGAIPATSDCGGVTPCTDATCAGSAQCLLMTSPLERVASHYWSRAVFEPLTIHIPAAVPCVHAFGPIVGDGACPYCAGFFPELYAGFIGRSFDPMCENVGNIAAALAGAVTLPDATLHVPLFDPTIFEGTGLRWISATEPTEWLGETGLRFVSLDATNAVSTLVYAQLGKLEALPALGQCSSGCLVAPPASALPLASSTEISTPVFVLSAMRSTLFLLNGTSSPIMAFDPSRGWHDLPPPSVPLGRVLAATYSPEWGALAVLDESSADHPRVARLLRLDPESGRTDVVAQWQRHALGRRFAISAGPGDRLYVASSIGAAHVVLALDADGTPRGIVARAGELTDAPVHASERGLSVVVAGATGPHAIGYEWSDFRPEHSMAERCF